MISIVIPTLNEAGALPGLLAALARETTDHEVIVVDGGSTDGTATLARRAGARVLESRPGRGLQLRAGAAVAQGDVLLFLHADTGFPAGGLAAIEDALARAPVALGGNFRLIFDGDSEFAQWLTGFYARIRARGIYYGDSGIFVRRAAYRALGSMPARALMEDYAFVRRMETLGETVCIETPPLVTSSRRFAGRRKARIVAGWLAIHTLYYLRVPGTLLAWLYNSRRRRYWFSAQS